MNRLRHACAVFAMLSGMLAASAHVANAGNRVCSVVTRDNWRDTIVVPGNWDAGWCKEYAKQVQADEFRLGCADDHGIRLRNPGSLNWPEGCDTGVPRRTKLCSVVTPGNWRDTIDVPDTWSGGNCRSYMKLVEANKFFLGCVDDSGVFFGDEGSTEWPARCTKGPPCGSSAPACNGDCPGGNICLKNQDGTCGCRAAQ